MTSTTIRHRLQPDTRPYSRTGLTALVAAITAVSAALRFVHLTDRSLWFDEAISVALARLPWLELRKVVTNREANMTFYYVVLHYWVKLGSSEYFVRSLSALFGAAAVPLVYLLGKRLFGARTGLVAAALLALNGYHIRYSQEARSYSLTVLLVVLSSLLFVDAVEGASRRAWNWYAIVSIVGVYAHFFAALIVIAQMASLLVRSRDERGGKDWLRSSVIIGLTCFPIAYFVLFKDKGQIDWVPRTDLRAIYGLFFDLAGHGGNLLLLAYAGAALATIFAVILVAGKLAPTVRWRFGLVISWLLVPLWLTLAVSLRKPIFLPRYLIVVLPALVLLVAAAVDWLRPRLVFAVALALVMGLSVFGIRAAYGEGYDPPRHYWREATAYVVANSQPGDGAVFYHPFGRVPFEYYRGLLHVPVDQPAAVYPLRGDGALLGSATASNYVLLAPDSPLMQQLATRPRVWIVLSVKDDDKSQAVQQWLRAHYLHESQQTFGIIRLFLYSK